MPDQKTDRQTRPLGAQISHMLMARRVKVIFGISGVHNQEMYRGIEEAGLTHVLTRHEQGAGFMADGCARATGSPGVAYVIAGPGLCNIMTPMGQAYSDSGFVVRSGRNSSAQGAAASDERPARSGRDGLRLVRRGAYKRRTLCADRPCA
jgi:hypothetical protein